MATKWLIRSNLYLTFLWVVLVLPTLLWWKDSILWVAMMSLWANIASHFAAYIAARSEQTQKEGHNLTKADRDWIDARFTRLAVPQITSPPIPAFTLDTNTNTTIIPTMDES